MRNFIKTMLTAALLFGVLGGVNSVKATKKYASISVATGATWDAGTNTMGFTDVNGWQILLTGLPSGNITTYSKIHATLSDMSGNIDNIRLRIKDNSDHYADYNLVSGENNVDIASLAAANPACDFASIADITLWSPTSAKSEQSVDGDHPASVVITDCYIEKPFVFAFDATGTAIVDVTDLKAWGCISLNPQTGVVTNSYEDPDNTNGYLKIDFSPAVDMSSVYGFKVNYTGDDILDGISVNDWRYKYGSNIYGRKDIAASMAEETSIEAWIWGARATTGSMTITSVEFYSSVISANPGEEALMSGLTNYHKDGSEWNTTGYTPNYRVNESTGAAYFGVDWNGEKCENYSDVEGYKAIRIYSAGDNTPRAMFFNSAANGQQAFNFTWNANGYYELLLSTVYASVNNYKLISIRPASGTTSSISGIYMIVDNPVYDYVISGNGVMTAGATAALADANATSIDATGLTNTSAIALESANPNCLFVANAGKLSNANNVIVDGTCANLVLTDGKPFKAPATFTATNAKFKKTVSAAQYATMVVPFDVATLPTSPSTVTAYELTAVDGEKITSSSVDALTADKPVLIHASAGNYEFTASGVEIAATADDEVTNGLLKASYAGTTAAVSEHNYVLQKHDTYGVNFYQVIGTAATMLPFRAYLVTPTDAPVLFLDFGNETTGINDVRSKMADVRGEVYNLNGQRVTQPSKGLYIVNGKKVVIK